ncbi:MAG: F0F1 ATP synthase subunit gamma [Actinomycetota bacterium]|nr:F0F1 ATP synthase subunit gamma [Actinomycetota bacterium]
MPGGGLRDIRRRIRSVKNTKQVTRAMELIAASRIARARRRVEDARPYAEMITEVVRVLASAPEVAEHELLAPHDEVRRVGLVVITSDRGLAGSYNTNALRRMERLAKEEREAGRELVHYVIGRKAESYLRFRGVDIERLWTGVSDRPGYGDAQQVGRAVMQAYVEHRIDRLWLVYTEFRTALVQVSRSARLLPVDAEEITEQDREDHEPAALFDFEPDAESILERLLPRYVEHRIFTGLLESAASEHASRQRAMKAATDNADEMIEELTRDANRARQATITTEINEIVGGAEALSQS